MDLYPEIEAFNKFHLRVSSVHELYVEQAGNPKGKPILFLHGGPGAGIRPDHRRYFNPQKYHIILFDQRGAGQSRPHADLRENTTWDLVADIENIRKRLEISKWHVFGGSWGSTLALAYAEAHPEAVSALILRGIFLCRPEEIRWFYQEGASWIFPDAWRSYSEFIPMEEKSNMVAAYYRRLTDANEKVRLDAATRWSTWEGSTLKLIPDSTTIDTFSSAHMALSLARIECHYFMNNAFFTKPNQLLADAQPIRHIPGIIVHGRYDVVCPVKNAFDLHEAWPESRLEVVANAGHAADEVGIRQALVRATDQLLEIV